MPTRKILSTIAVNEAAAMVPIGPRQFRNLCELETEKGKSKFGLTYFNRRAHIDREVGLAKVKELQAERRLKAGAQPQSTLVHFQFPNAIDPETGARICIEYGCPDFVSGRGKLCTAHSSERAVLRQLKKLRSRRATKRTL